jgi:carboxyl-terminal processing protease
MMRSFVRKAALILFPTFLVVCAVSTGGSQQQTSPSLFDPVYEIYQDVQNYFYKPELINDQQAVYGAMKGVVEQLNDPYSEFFDPEEKLQFDASLEGEFSGVGIEISIKNEILTVIAPLGGTPAEAAGVVAGDQILAIDGKSSEGLTLSEAGILIRGATGTAVTLTIRHEDGAIVDIPIVRADIVIDPVSSGTLADGTIGYIRIQRFDSDTVAMLDVALGSFDLESMTGLVLDLRNDPGGLMAAAISTASRFVDEGIVLRTQDRLAGEKLYWSKGNRLPNLPLAILINRGSASASEITAGAIRDNNMGILIGETSYGKGVFQTLCEYDDGSALKITAGEYFTPAGRVVNDVGLVPDIAVEDDGDPLAVAVVWIQEHAGALMPIDLGEPPTATP